VFVGGPFKAYPELVEWARFWLEWENMKPPCAVYLQNAETVSQQRLGRRVAQLSATRMNEVCAARGFLWDVIRTS
jgi:mRNA-degrading endonuclease toxin of MazEF toxin-antitoxin module